MLRRDCVSVCVSLSLFLSRSTSSPFSAQQLLLLIILVYVSNPHVVLFIAGGMAYKVIDVVKYITCREWRQSGLLTVNQQRPTSLNYGTVTDKLQVVNRELQDSQHSMLVKSLAIWVDGMPMNGHEFTLARLSLQGEGFSKK